MATAMAAEPLGKTHGLAVTRIAPTDHPGDQRVILDFFDGGGPKAGPFVAITVDQWTGLQHLARTIGWPAA